MTNLHPPKLKNESPALRISQLNTFTWAAKSYNATTYWTAGFGFGFDLSGGGGGGAFFAITPESTDDCPFAAGDGVYGGCAMFNDGD